jgi:hypothetical protein
MALGIVLASSGVNACVSLSFGRLLTVSAWLCAYTGRALGRLRSCARRT